MHLSPSTVCARIKGLESSLGVPLFTRSAQGMAVTPAGEIVRQGALRIERDIDWHASRSRAFRESRGWNASDRL